MTEPFNLPTQDQLLEIIRRQSHPMQAVPTGVEPRLQVIANVRAVVFDVYGTLLVSGSGDVGTTDVDSRPAAFGEALTSIGMPWEGDNKAGVELVSRTIARHHSRDRTRGVDHPEVDIREVWRDVITALVDEGSLDESTIPSDMTRLALEYEMRTNPVAAMPDCRHVLQQIREAGLILGIVSNAQVFTRLLFPGLLNESLDDLGFDPQLCVWSYKHRRAKPGTFLYEQMAAGLESRGVAAHEVLYVGNDMLKDVWPASQVGFHTALFAGDRRSYRPRKGDERVRGIEADLVLTNLAQLPECVITTN